MSQKSKNKIAVHVPDWLDMRTLCEEYKIGIDELAEAIEERKIQTRGRLYDDRCDYIESNTARADGFVEIPEEKWSEYLFESNSFELRPSTEHTSGKKVTLTFLVRYEYEAFLGVVDAMPARSGYTDIEVNRADFESKIKIKTAPTGKRTHKQIQHIKLIYNNYKKLRKVDWVSPQEFLQYTIDNYWESGGNIKDFEITDIEEHPTDRRKSVIKYEVEGKNSESDCNSITIARFETIISKFNNPKNQ